MSKLALKLIALAKRTKATVLDLGMCGLTELPDKLFELSQLEELNVCNKYWDYEQENWNKSKNIGKPNKLNQLKFGISKLKKLKIIRLNGDHEYGKFQIVDASFLGKLTGLQSIDLSYNKIVDCSFLTKLTGLQSIDLSYNKVTNCSFLEKLTNLKLLDLSFNRISNISFLEKLASLQLLDLTSNQISDTSFFEKLTNLQSLYISSNQISDISFLEKLTSLHLLDLSDNQISNISFLEKLPGLQSLYLSSNQISNCSFLGKLTGLRLLYLASNQITNCAFLEKLKNLQKLDLRFNEIMDISCLQHLHRLNLLKLSSNKISDVSHLENLTNLKKLDLNSNQISNISALTNLNDLRVLELAYNKISDISFLENLFNLHTLELSSNKISNIAYLGSLHNLEKLDLNGNDISDISNLIDLLRLKKLSIGANNILNLAILKNLTSLQTLNVYNNSISDISFLTSLNFLKSLDLGYNQISDISLLKHLTQLQELYIGENQISDISTLEHLTELQTLYLYSNPIEGLDTSEEHKNYIDEAKEYIARKAAKGNTKIKLPVKILMLGNHSVGKSVLSNYFIHNEIVKTDSTHILEVKPYPVNTKGKLPKAIFYDFGGQDYYHGLYRIFLSKEAINILLWNRETNQNKLAIDSKDKLTHHFNINYWLAHKDFRESKFEYKDILYLIETGIDKKQEENILNTEFKVDCHMQLCLAQNDEENLKNSSTVIENSYKAGHRYFVAILKATIEQKQKPITDNKWYFEFLEGIYSNTLIKNRSALKPVQLNRIIKETNYKNIYKKEARDIYKHLQTQLSQLHNSGLVLYYKEIEHLRDVVWLNPASLITAIHNKIFKNDLFKNSDTPGIMPADQLKDQLGLDINKDNQLIELLKLQKVLFHHHAKIENEEKLNEYIIPNFLPLVDKNDPNYYLTVFGLSQPAFVLRFEHFMPMGLINQLICFFGKQPDRKLFWRDQLLFTLYRKARILINIDFVKLSITISIQLLENTGIKIHDLKKYLFKVLLAMYWDYEPLEFEEDIEFDLTGMKEIINEEGGDVAFYSKSDRRIEIPDVKLRKWLSLVNDLSKNEHLKPKDLYISNDNKHFVKYIDIAKTDRNVIEAFPLIKDKANGHIFNFVEPKIIHKNRFNAFMEKPVAAPKKVFISYSKHDEEAVESKLLPSLKNLERQQKITIWYDKKLQAGEEWDFQIKEQLQQANIILFIVSVNFIATNYIWDIEIKKAIDRHNKEEATVIPIILRPCDWTGDATPFSKLQAIPEKPITRFDNQDDAWLEVLQKFKKVIE